MDARHAHARGPRRAALSDARNDGQSRTLTVLGCDGSYPGPGGAASGYLLEAVGVSLWLDAGAGTFAALQLVTDPARIDAVVLSHEHPDHWSDLDSYAVWLAQHAPNRAVPVYAPPGLRARAYSAEDTVLEWHEVQSAHRVLIGARPSEPSRTGETTPPRGARGLGAGAGALMCSFGATDHGPPTLAVRVDAVPAERIAAARAARPVLPDEDCFAYSADTGPDWSVEELGTGIGTFLCEATYTRDEEGEGRHLSGRQAASMAASAGVGRLVLTHRRPSVDPRKLAAEAQAAFGRVVDHASQGRVFEW